MKMGEVVRMVLTLRRLGLVGMTRRSARSVMKNACLEWRRSRESRAGRSVKSTKSVTFLPVTGVPIVAEGEASRAHIIEDLEPSTCIR